MHAAAMRRGADKRFGATAPSIGVANAGDASGLYAVAAPDDVCDIRRMSVRSTQPMRVQNAVAS
jgi:hypothetical protein